MAGTSEGSTLPKPKRDQDEDGHLFGEGDRSIEPLERRQGGRCSRSSVDPLEVRSTGQALMDGMVVSVVSRDVDHDKDASGSMGSVEASASSGGKKRFFRGLWGV